MDPVTVTAASAVLAAMCRFGCSWIDARSRRAELELRRAAVVPLGELIAKIGGLPAGSEITTVSSPDGQQVTIRLPRSSEEA